MNPGPSKQSHFQRVIPEPAHLTGSSINAPSLQMNPPKLPCFVTYPEELKKKLEKLITFYGMVFVHM